MSAEGPTAEEKQIVRGKLLQLFDDAALEAFCQTYFPEVQGRFSRGLLRDEKVTLLIAHCCKQSDKWARLIQLLQDTQTYQHLPQTPRDAYLLNLVRQSKEWDKKYIPISGEPEGMHHTDLTEPEGFIPTNFVIAFERYFPSEKQVERIHFERIEEAINIHKQFLLLGPPGAGKTTILRKLLYDAAKAAVKDQGKPIPFFIRLEKDWPDNIEDVPALLNSFGSTHGLRSFHPSEVFVMFDGLNEIQRQHRERRMQKLREWVSAHRSTATVVVSCRTDYDLSDFLPDVPRVKINPLDNDCIRRYGCISFFRRVLCFRKV